uniref:Putative secreted protein n=1 Tax=Anopheles marajoara TaxID=58244 RepID=A0A2M4CC18_9DIPT
MSSVSVCPCVCVCVCVWDAAASGSKKKCLSKRSRNEKNVPRNEADLTPALRSLPSSRSVGRSVAERFSLNLGQEQEQQ